MVLMNRFCSVGLSTCLVMHAAFLGGCGNVSRSSPSPSVDAADTGADTPKDSSVHIDVSGDVQVEAKPLPEGVPEGWQEYTGWSTECPLYLPGTKGQMPAPIEWEPCPAPIPSSLACRRMKSTWYEGRGGIGLFAFFSLDLATGAPLLFFSRWRVGGDENVVYRLVAEVDGPVRFATLQLNAHERANGDFKCWAGTKDLRDNRFVLGMDSRDQGDGATYHGALAGDIDSPLPTAVVRQRMEGMFTSSWTASARWLVQLSIDSIRAWPWDVSTSTLVYSPKLDPERLQGHLPTQYRNDVFVPIGDLSRCGIVAWNEQQGLKPLLRWVGDSTQGAGNFGTDGTHMVWTYAKGPGACDTDPPHPEIWTAPYTLDADELRSKARRLRSDMRGMSTDPYVVGFGYAARAIGSMPAPYRNGLMIVRISDGFSWILSGADATDDLAWDKALGFSPQELFATVTTRDVGTTIVRIRLDSLGPGISPD